MAALDDVRKGLKLEVDGRLYRVIDFQYVKTGGQASVRAELKGVGSGTGIEKIFDADGQIKFADAEEWSMQYLYAEGDDCVFMDAATGEQLQVPSGVVGDAAKYLTDGSQAAVTLYQGLPREVAIPAVVTLEVVETEPASQGDGTKPATLETGAEVKVPLFITTGDKVKVNTRDDSCLGRVK
ncbi:elongation factor P [Streptomyces sp. AM8-1-1]|uniref:elongation factor P n=1 Tax=Streptomyces sp. AM8-1-1 TaxID=3075825 RepID=UPI0028C402FD|nr:elongation factor P [Streptomyces sp. AM8-1-1]WNO70208.1 elongation factor P [Streptomyces sp. AM8-1-1]